MSKQIRNKYKNLLIVVCFIGIVALGFMFYQEKAQNQRGYELFLNRFYMELSPAINDIDYLIENEVKDEASYKNRVNLLESRLAKLDAILDLGSATLPYNIQDQPSFTQYADLENLNEVIDNDDYLKGLKEVLLFVQEEMYSEDMRQEDPNLPVNEFNQIIKSATSLYKEKLF